MNWEEICSRCGLCCHEKTIYPDYLEIDLSSPCEYYDSENHLCTVYSSRFQICSRCEKVTPLKAMLSSSLPSSCAYVAWAEHHHIRLIRKRETVLVESTS